MEEKIIQKLFPGPLTIIFQKSKEIPNVVTGNLDTIGIRMPKNDLCQDIIRRLRRANSIDKL